MIIIRMLTACALVVAVAAQKPCAAQTRTWTGNGGDNNWSTTTNWSPTSAPPSGIDTTLEFGPSARTTPNQNIANPFLLNSLTVPAAAPGYTMTGGSLDFRTSGVGVLPKIVTNSANTLTVRNSLTLTNTTEIGGVGDVTIDQGGATVVGAGGMTKTGSGTLLLINDLVGSSNSFAGPLTVTEGTVEVISLRNAGVNSSAGAGSSIVLGGATTTGTLRWRSDISTNRSITLNAGGGVLMTDPGNATLTGVISGPGGLTVAGDGYVRTQVAVFGVNTYEGPTLVSNGRILSITNSSSLGQNSSVTLTGASLQLNGAAISGKTLTMNPAGGEVAELGAFLSTAAWNGNIVLNGGETVQHKLLPGPGALAISGAISGSAGLQSTGAVTLSSGNTFTGPTTMVAGPLVITHNLALQNSTTTLNGNGFDLSTTTAPVLGALGGAGNVAVDGRVLTAGGNNASTTYSGTISVGAGGSFTKSGTGAMTVNGAISSAGTTNINGGALALGSVATVSGALQFGGGELKLLSARSVDNAITVNAGGGGFNTNGFDLALASNIVGAGGVTKTSAGVATVTGVNTYAGGTTVNGGTWRVGSATAVPTAMALNVGAAGTFDLNNFDTTVASLTGAGSVTLGSGTLTVGNASDSTFAGAISGLGGLVKVGSGKLTLSGVSTYTGSTTVQAGTLALDGVNVSLGAGSIRALTGGAVQYKNATINGGFLRGPGTHAILAGGVNSFSGVTTFGSTTLVVDGTSTFTNFNNGGDVTTNAAVTWDGGGNASSGRVAIAGAAAVSDFTNDGRLTIGATGVLNNSLSNLVSGGGSEVRIDAGGALNLAAGTKLVLQGALLWNQGTITGETEVRYGSTAKGSGMFGAVNVFDGGVFAPGNSPGAAQTLAATWGAGGRYQVELADAAGPAGAAWDLWDIGGGLSITSGTTNNTKFVIELDSLNGGAAGPAANFDNTRSYQWLVATTDGGIQGFDASRVALDVSGFANPLGGGQLSLFPTSSELFVIFTPAVVTLRAADFNSDGFVNGADFLAWQRGLGTTSASRADGDANADGDVDADDLAIWRASFASVQPVAAAVPEPGTGLLAIVVLGALGRITVTLRGRSVNRAALRSPLGPEGRQLRRVLDLA